MLAAGTRGGMGGTCKAAYAHEWARLMVLLQAMQIREKGVNIWGTTTGPPYNYKINFPGYAEWGINKLAKNLLSIRKQKFIAHSCRSYLNPPISWLGQGFCGLL
jgi:trimethylamine-N-oxide reductase (cytochrome c)